MPARVLWSASAIVLTVLLYAVVLRFAFPGYVRPLTPFHTDFYEYVTTANVSLQTLTAFPRPIAFGVMWLLGHTGVQGLMAAGIAIALAGILLTIRLAARLTNAPRWQLFIISGLYLILLFAQPQFYFEHRHDLPAEVSYLGLLAACHGGLSWARSRSVWAGLGALAGLVVFAFSKETFFLSAPCLALGLLIFEKGEARRRAWWFLCAVLTGITASWFWNRHVSSPFVDPRAGAGSEYGLVSSLSRFGGLYWHYLRLLITPATAGICVLAVAALIAFRSRTAVMAVAALGAGLAALIPHALLPNHVVDEYAWIGGPLLLSPLLLLTGARQVQENFSGFAAAATLVSAFAFMGHDGYRHGYRSIGLRWQVSQEERTAHFMESWSRLRELPGGSAVLVAGLDTPFLPWHSQDFCSSTFGKNKRWKVLEKPPHRPTDPGWLLSFEELPIAADYTVSYDQEGRMAALRTAREARVFDANPGGLVPKLAAAQTNLRAHPTDRGAILAALDEAAEWGDEKTAQMAYDAAGRAGLAGDSWVRFFREKLQRRHAAAGGG